MKAGKLVNQTSQLLRSLVPTRRQLVFVLALTFAIQATAACSASSSGDDESRSLPTTSQVTDQTGKSESVEVEDNVTETTAEPSAISESPGSDAFPDVIAVDATQDGDGSWTFAVTISSPYDSPERYADAWRVAGLDGEVFGIRELTHDHASEQPFTRSMSGIEIPAEVTEVSVQGRDQLNGWGGATISLTLG